MAFAPAELKAASLTVVAVTNAHREVSPYSFKQVAYDFMGGMWRATLDLAHVEPRDAAAINRWLVSLDGAFTPFEMRLPDYKGPFGVLTVNPTVATAAAAQAKTLTLTFGAGDALVADDHITIDGHLHVVTSAAAKVGNDQVITIWPRLRAAVSPADPVEALAPYGTWALAGPEVSYGISQSWTRSQSLDLVEVL